MRYHSLIAVVGMAGLFPGASDLRAYWQNIVSKTAAMREVSPDRWIADRDRMVSPLPAPDKALNSRCCTVDRLDFDPSGLNLDPGLANDLDPLYHMVLDVGRRSVSEPAQITLNRRRTGIVLAAICLPTDTASSITRKLFRALFEKTLFGKPAYRLPSKNVKLAAGVTALPAAILARALGLGGGSYTLDAACASSLYAVKLACDELIARRADAMLAGGVSRPDCLYTQVGFSQLRALSPSGRCAPFDRRADGLVVGEGAGILVLKRLEDAIAANDHIHGVIHGIGVSNDMRGNLLAPESSGQVRAMQAAYDAAGWHPTDIDLIECHGAGTPIGDITELNSLCTLWGDTGWTSGQCAIGSVKSMIGHLLTAAGVAGIIKTLLALKEKTLPPSLNFDQPAMNSPLTGSPFRVQTDHAHWPSPQDRCRRAAVSAFGFGGINGHLLLEEWAEDSKPKVDALPAVINPDTGREETTAPKKPTKPPSIAVVGMAVSFGPMASLQAFQEIIFNGRSIIGNRPNGRWKGLSSLLDLSAENLPHRGGFMPNLRIGVNEFRIPPKEIPDILPQHLLMLQVAAGAMADAGLSEVRDRPRMGAVIGLDFDFEASTYHFRWSLPALARKWRRQYFPGMDEQALDEWTSALQNAASPPLNASRTLGALGGIIASRIAREFRFGGASFGVSAEAASGNRALEIGVRSLQRKETDAVLVGAVDLAGDIRQIITSRESGLFSAKGTVAPFDAEADGTLPGEGAVALVIKRHEQAVADGDRVYALVSGIGNSCGDPEDGTGIGAETFSLALKQALTEADASPRNIDYVETIAPGIPNRDRTITRALKAVFSDGKNPCSVGSSIANLGHSGAASGLAAVVKTALSLYQEIIPPLTGYRSAADDIRPGHGFILPLLPRYWFRNRQDGPRRACIVIGTGDGNIAATVLQQASDRLPRSALADPIKRKEKRHPLGPAALGLFVVQGQNPRTLLAAVEKLRRYADRQNAGRLTAEEAAHRWLHGQPLDSTLPLAAVLLAPDVAALKTLTHDARQAIEAEIPRDFGSSGGVCFRPTPLNGGDLAFVYPGSGNHYPGMGREIALHWPEVIRQLDTETLHLKSQFRPDVFMSRSYGTDRPETNLQNFANDPLDPIIGPVAFGCMTTTLMQCFKVIPQAVIGYSLGEVTGLIAMQAWPDRNEVFERMQATDLFHRQLSGPCLAARQAWKMSAGEKFEWRTAVVNRPAETIRKAIDGLATVRLLIVNTPEECVVGGDQEQVATLIRRLKCQAIDLKGVITVHCDVLAPVADQYRALHVFPTVAPQGVRFYSCSSGRAYTPTTDSAAASILSQALHGFEFPPTIEQAYADGVRLFLELGPGTSCSRMIRRILGDRPHLSYSLDLPGSGGIESVLKGIGTLIAERVPLDLQWLYPTADRSRPGPAAGQRDIRNIVEIPVGGKMLCPSSPEATDSMQSAPSPETRSSVSSPEPDEKRPPSGVKESEILKPQKPPQSDSPFFDHWDDKHRPSPVVPIEQSSHGNLIDEFTRTMTATAAAHSQYLDFSTDLSRKFDEAVSYHSRLVEALSGSSALHEGNRPEPINAPRYDTASSTPVAYDRKQCLEFAIGKVARVLGADFAPVDSYRTRVRLPAEPLMLVDRIVSVEGIKGSLTSGRLVTEHDVLTGAWYLDGDRAPVCIAVEAGQADLFLCSYLGIDLAVKGERVYRLLDASVVFHRELPRPGDTIRYEIKIEKFIRQGQTVLFFFNFEGSINNQPLISMTDGCAGFFTEEEIQHSGGIIPTAEDRETVTGKRDPQWTELVPQARESYTDDQIECLRTGNLSACFGPGFDGVVLSPSLRLPNGRMKLIDRIQHLDPHGGRYGLGSIRAEADIHPDDWFLTCHFVDDMTMPGTLMYECCAHTLRVFLQRLGWVSDRADVHYDTIPGIKSVLRCRGPVTPRTRQVIYEVELKELGYGPAPYALADAHMYADGRYIVRFTDMAIRLSGLTRELLENDWKARRRSVASPQTRLPKQALYDRQQILAFTTGKPSQAFGDRYTVFDSDRFIARLPAPPYAFLDRVISVEPEPWKLKPGGWIEAEFDVRPDDWYFRANRSDNMPYCILLEIALQACGWLAAYAGSALRSSKALRFRNLDGQATLLRDIPAAPQVLNIRCRMTKVSSVGDFIIESFDFQVLGQDQMIYEGNTVFGFFTPESLADQKGIKVDKLLRENPESDSTDANRDISLPDEAPLTPDDIDNPKAAKGLSLPAKALRMIDRVEVCDPLGGLKGLGYLRASKKIDPGEWFFKAHFYQDPVCPGSLGVESFLQLLKYDAIRRWGNLTDGHRFEHVHRVPHTWQYRGQIIPQNHTVKVEAFITFVKNQPTPELRADGILTVDGLAIYHMKDYGIRIVPR